MLPSMLFPSLNLKSRRIVSNAAAYILAGDGGLEPPHAGIKIQCLNQLGESPTNSALRILHCNDEKNLVTSFLFQCISLLLITLLLVTSAILLKDVLLMIWLSMLSIFQEDS